MTVQNYVTLAQVKAYWPENQVSTSNIFDALITTLCTNLSRAFDLLTWRTPGDFYVTDAVTKYFDGVPSTATDYQDILNVGELAEAPSSVVIDGTLVPNTDYFLWPYNAAVEYVPYTALMLNPDGQRKSWRAKPRGIVVTGKFGYSAAIPPDVQEALLLYAVKFVRKAQQNYMETGTLLDSSQVFIEMKGDTDLENIILFRRKSRLAGRSPSSAVTRW